jgi:hypothetical protein
MAARKRNLPPSLRNPFEKAGFDREIIEALVATGDASLDVALNGLRRSVARALHPDTVGSVPEASAEYLDDFLQATSRLMGMEPADRKKLAQAFVRGRRQVVREKPIEYESKDLHDGTLLQNMIDMVAESGESIYTARNRKILIRPVDFSLEKPSDFRGEPYAWYPPESARMTLLEVDEHGISDYQQMKQMSFAKLLRKEYRVQDVDDLYKKKVRSLSFDMWDDLGPVVGDLDLASFQKDDETLILDKKDGILNVFQGATGAYVGSAPESRDSVINAADGIYTFGFRDTPTTHSNKGILYDAHYIYDDQEPGKDIKLNIFGTCDGSYIDLQRSQIYDRPQDQFVAHRQLELPSTTKKGDVSRFTIPSQMYKHVQKVYAPQLITEDDRHRYVLAVDADKSLSILGRLVSSTARHGSSS